MNYAFARNQYTRSRHAGLTGISDPHEMITLTLKELIKSIDLLQNPELDPEKRKTSFSKSFTAIYILQTSLDFEKGGEIAESLFKVYEYCRAQVQKAFKKDSSARLETCLTVLNDIIDAWEKIK
jgi:flagellar protein FliS